jgi:hypothetical protein
MTYSYSSEYYDGIPVLYWLKFDGPDLMNRSVSTMELSLALDALQNLFYKAYLFEHLAQGGDYPEFADTSQTQLDMQIITRRKGSDIYGIGALVNALSIQFLGGIAVSVFERVMDYTSQRITKAKSKRQLEDLTPDQYHSLQMFKMVEQLANLANENRGITEIELELVNPKIVVHFDTDTKEYLKTLKGKPFFGCPETTTGTIRSLNYGRLSGVLESGSFRTTVFFNKPQFDEVRMQPDTDLRIQVRGKRILRTGETDIERTEIVADEVIFLP